MVISHNMAPTKSKKKQSSDGEEYDSEYRKKRDRNNQAVKKSRFKSRQKTAETVDRINDLKKENDTLTEKVTTLTKELKFLKDLFLAHAANSSNSNLNSSQLEKILAEDDTESN